MLTGFHPDPSVCRRPDGGFLLVTSSFEYFPGVPIFASHDLVSWTPLGHVLDRKDQLDLAGIDSSDGIWAATIREHEGTYYVVSTLVRDRKGGGNFVVTATDPAGSWSEPVWLPADGIDPSLFFDDDGRCWFTACRDNPGRNDPNTSGLGAGNPGELWMQELDTATMRFVGDQYVLWRGAMEGAWVEGPHLYKRDGIYYLVAAEGGTERNHAVTVASSTTVTGPYRGLASNPVLTHRHLGSDFPIQNVGHADLVDTAAGETWAVVLGVRPKNGHHVLGREVFLVPVRWEQSGPVFAPGVGHIRLWERRPANIPRRPGRTRTDNAAITPDQWHSFAWSTLRYPRAESGISTPIVTDGKRLSLSLLPGGLGGVDPVAALLRRQEHHVFAARVILQFDPLSPVEEAGIAVVQNRNAFATTSLGLGAAGERVIVTRVHTGDGDVVTSAPAPEGSIELAVVSDGATYEFLFRGVGVDRVTAMLVESGVRHLGTEQAGGFTGVTLGPYATSNGALSDSVATFTDFRYEPVGTSGV
ncbi:MAG: glycoside hydrolase 43 family protein [Glaciihabitans sp.]|nr:glycoside hydrolase 43 family protein [Glaciihabitans sp.]